MQNSVRLGRQLVLNKENWISSRITKKPWNIKYNGSIHGMKDEAETIREELSKFTGLNKETFPCNTGLPKHKDLKIWFGEKLLWSHTESQKLPSPRELIEQIELDDDKETTFNWKKH
jgi:hypothetical protein|tara:strand:+ start:92 stop:442 length:351 start_codon:yes stop_codon:yes gene_type:complete